MLDKSRKPNRLWRSTYQHSRFYADIIAAVAFMAVKKARGCKVTSELKRINRKDCAIVYWNEPE